MVSRGSLALSIAQLASVAITHRPPKRLWLSVPVFSTGWVTGELAPHWTAVTIGRLWLNRQDHSTSARIARFCDVASIAGHALSIRTSLESKAQLASRAARAWPQAAEATSTFSPTALQYVVPFALQRRSTTQSRNINYTSPPKSKKNLHIVSPTVRQENMPIIIHVPGGGWTISNKDQQGIDLLHSMAAQGWLGISMNYPLSPRHRWPEHIVAVKEAIKWVKENAHQYGGNPDFIILTGGSAGAQLVACAALSANLAKWQPGFESTDTSVQGCLALYGPHDMAGDSDLTFVTTRRNSFSRIMFGKPDPTGELLADTSPRRLIHADAPPFCITHGTFDSLIPEPEGREFAARLSEVSTQPVTYLPVLQAQHAFDVFASIRSSAARGAHETFLRHTYMQWLHTSTQAETAC